MKKIKKTNIDFLGSFLEEYRKYQNKKLTQPIRFFDFIWRKKYKPFIRIIWVLGLLLFVFGEYILSKLNINIENITASEKILGFIYFTTAVIIFWYTRETYDLKIIQQKELQESRRKSDFDIMPYFRLQLSDLFSPDSFIGLINDGRGLAKDIKLEVIYEGRHYNIIPIQVVAAGPCMQSGIDLKHIVGADFDLFNEWKEKRSKGKWDFIIEGKYLDFYDRLYFAKFKFNTNVKDFFEIVEQHSDGWNIDKAKESG